MVSEESLKLVKMRNMHKTSMISIMKNFKIISK